MGAWSVKQICDRAKAAEAQRAVIQPLIDRAMEFAMPWRQRGKSGAMAFDRLFDSTGPTGVHKFASRIQRDLTPPFQRWFKLEAGPLVDPEDAEEINRQLEMVTEVVHAALDASAFPKASHEMYSDLAIGTGALLAIEGDDREPIKWDAVPPWALAIEEGGGGRIDNVYWRRTYEAHQLPDRWPRARWPEAVKEKIDAGAKDEVEILQASYYDADLQGWRFSVICLSGDDKAEVWASEHRTNPWNIPRWWTTPGNPWGLGPLLLVLPDIMTANKAVEMILKAAAYALAPPIMVAHDGVVNPDTLTIAPHSLIRVARTGGPMGSSIQTLDMNGRVDLADLALSDRRANILQNLMARTLPAETASVRSPTEIVERLKEFAFDTGSAFGRMNHEFVPAIIARVIDILDKKKVPGIDFGKLKVDHLVLRVRVISPLARSQNLEDVENAVRWMELVKAIGGPELLMAIANIEELHKLAAMMGAPGWVTRPAAQRDKMLEAMGAAAAGGLEVAPPAAGDLVAPGEQPALRLVQ